MKVSRKKLPAKFESFEVTVTIESQQEYDTFKTLFMNSSAGSLQSSVQYHDLNAAKGLNIDILYLFLTKIRDCFK